MKIHWILMVFFSFLLMACNSSEDQRQMDYFNRVRNRTMELPEPIPKLENLAKFYYFKEENRPNPFQVQSTKLVKNKIVVSKERLKQPLEQFSLASLKFVGLLKKQSQTLALISRSDGVLSSLKIGDFLGKNEGRVIAITESSLQVEERIFVAGKWTKEVKDIYLNSKK